MPTNFVSVSLCALFQEISGIEKCRVMKRGTTILYRNGFDSQYRIISQENPSVCHYFWVSKRFLLKWVVSVFSIRFLSHSIEKFRRGNLLCCVSENFMVAKKFLDKKGNHDFASSLFCLTEPKQFVGDPSSASLLSIIESFSA